jgi:hypothetical protein
VIASGDALLGGSWRRASRTQLSTDDRPSASAWREIPERSIFEATPDLRLRIEPLDEG